MINYSKLKECKRPTCELNENFKTCLSLMVIISLVALALIGVTLLIEGKMDEDKQSYEELVRTSKKTIVRSGYWPDGMRWCSVDDPCIMNCKEYNRFDIGCGPENPGCTHGRYDWCRDEQSQI
tara:strand:+ start:486 stop:854 length:369 start_codon:yes stop_codon:yes gene_type:complete